MLNIALAFLLAAGASSLVDAVKSGDRTSALALLQQKVNVNTPEPDGTTALHWAVQRDDFDLADRLIKAGANVNTKNDYGSSPMSEAALNGNVAMLDRLLKAGTDVESPNADGMTTLMIIARSSNVEAARLLLKHGAKVNTVEKWKEQTALIWAAAESEPAMVKTLVEAGADVNAHSKINNWERQVTAEARAIARPSGGMTPLLYAARQGCTECVKILAEANADLDLGDPDNVSPLLVATLNGRWDIAKYLINKGANVNKWDWWGQSPLYAAVDMNTIPHGGRPDRPSLDDASSLEVIELLLKKGANPNLQLKLLPPFRSLGADRGVDSMLTIGATPLLRAAKAMDAPAIELLLKYGANPNLPTTRGMIPIVAAAGVGSVDADTRGWFTTEDVQQRAIASLDLLLKAGGDVNAADPQRGTTLLHGAAFWGWNDVVKYLVSKGAKLDAKDSRGFTPIDSALGKAGGNSRGGQRVDVHQDTADLLKQLCASASLCK
jgi:ankyrin repeat protein